MSGCAIQAYFKKEILIHMTCGESCRIQSELHKRLIKIETLRRKLIWPEYTHVRCACNSFRPTRSFYEYFFWLFDNLKGLWDRNLFKKIKWKQAPMKFKIATTMHNSKMCSGFTRLILHALGIYHLGKWYMRCCTKAKAFSPLTWVSEIMSDGMKSP